MKKTILLASFIFLSFLPFTVAHGATQGVMELNVQGTHHIEAIVQTLDGQAIPDMKVTVIIENMDTGVQRVETMHPMFSGVYHYGSNVDLPEGNYAMTWHLDPPSFMRGSQRENMWTQPVEFQHTFDSSVDTHTGYQLGALTSTDMQIVFEAWPAKAMYITEGAHEMNMEPAEEHEQNNNVMVAPRTKWFYWQTWAALLMGILGGSVAMWALSRERQ